MKTQLKKNFAISISRKINLTGATTNDFGNNAVTGTTILSAAPNTTSNVVPIASNVVYANPINGQTSSVSINILQTGDTITDSIKDDFLKYPTDMEYFQVITGVSVSDFINMSSTSNTNLFPKRFLRHQIVYTISSPSVVSQTPTASFSLSSPIIPLATVNGNTYNNVSGVVGIDANYFDCLDSLSNGLVSLYDTKFVDAFIPRCLILFL